MRVMPTQGSGPSRTGGLVLSHAFSAHGFFCDENNQERRNSGKEFLFRSDSSVSCFPYSSFYMNTPNGQFPNSKKIYVAGEIHPDIRVPFREISLAPTKSLNGDIEINEPVRVYDTSGPWTDPSVDVD